MRKHKTTKQIFKEWEKLNKHYVKLKKLREKYEINKTKKM